MEEILEWADHHVAELYRDMVWEEAPNYSTGGYWEAFQAQDKTKILARVTAALAFLEQFTGKTSRWTQDAQNLFTNHGEHQSMETGARAVGDVIKKWAELVRSGQEEPIRIGKHSARSVASTDLMEQVRVLNKDETIIPAAPIVLAGAALEIALRSAVEELDIALPKRRGIISYAKALTENEVLDEQLFREAELMADIRNKAAHGEHKELSSKRANLMEQQVSLFLSNLKKAVIQAS